MSYKRFLVTGNGTGVGKTLASAALAAALSADYWKPIQSGTEEEMSDSDRVKELFPDVIVHPESYSFRAALAPSQAARREGCEIDVERIQVPVTERSLIIETAGGLLVPLGKELMIDLFCRFQGAWIIISRHYLGSINHTLLTIEALQKRKQPILGLIFNGEECESEEEILRFSGLPCLGVMRHGGFDFA